MSGPVHSIASVFSRASTPAAAISGLSTLVLAVCLAIFAVVAGVLTYTVVRFSRPGIDPHREPPQVYGSNQIEIAWTVIPVVIVLVLSMATARVISEVQDKRPAAGALRVTVDRVEAAARELLARVAGVLHRSSILRA
jgi:cytochrome c oxidase subunit 2